MPNNITGVDPFFNNDFTEDVILNLFIPSLTTSTEIPEGTYDWEILSVDIPKKKRDEFSEIERICKYPHNDKQIEL